MWWLGFVWWRLPRWRSAAPLTVAAVAMVALAAPPTEVSVSWKGHGEEEDEGVVVVEDAEEEEKAAGEEGGGGERGCARGGGGAEEG